VETGAICTAAPASQSGIRRLFPRDAGKGRKLGLSAQPIPSRGLQFGNLEAEIGKSLRPNPRIFPFCGDCRRRPGSITPLPPDRGTLPRSALLPGLNEKGNLSPILPRDYLGTMRR
jgi:hypothetical protein